MNDKLETIYKISGVDGNPYLQVIRTFNYKTGKNVYVLYRQDGGRCFLGNEGVFEDYHECTTAIHRLFGSENIKEVEF